MRIEAYNDNDQQQRGYIKMAEWERDALFRLKGFLDGVGAPEEIQKAFSNLLTVATGGGDPIGPAVIR
jgi:hypothetical protein